MGDPLGVSVCGMMGDRQAQQLGASRIAMTQANRSVISTYPDVRVSRAEPGPRVQRVLGRNGSLQSQGPQHRAVSSLLSALNLYWRWPLFVRRFRQARHHRRSTAFPKLSCPDWQATTDAMPVVAIPARER